MWFWHEGPTNPKRVDMPWLNGRDRTNLEPKWIVPLSDVALLLCQMNRHMTLYLLEAHRKRSKISNLILNDSPLGLWTAYVLVAIIVVMIIHGKSQS